MASVNVTKVKRTDAGRPTTNFAGVLREFVCFRSKPAFLTWILAREGPDAFPDDPDQEPEEESAAYGHPEDPYGIKSFLP